MRKAVTRKTFIQILRERFYIGAHGRALAHSGEGWTTLVDSNCPHHHVYMWNSIPLISNSVN